jgi:hypothetical protein
LASSEPIATEEALALGATAFVPKDSVNSHLASVVSELVFNRPISVGGRQAGDDAA